uniref:SSD domain-containing protein n=3 Tax=Wuchereria bancrofti TaxID=6293 RepID=A0AAF5PZS6_WUCBA
MHLSSFYSFSTEPGSQTRLVQFVNLLHRRWSYFIADHVTGAIIISVLVSIVCTAKVVTTPFKNDLMGFIPYGARSREEYAVQEEFTNHSGKGILLMALIVAKDNGSTLRAEILKEAVEVDELISNNFTIHNHILGRAESFNEFCRNFCLLNLPLQQFYNGFEVQLERFRAHQPLNDRISLNYPISKMYGRAFNIQMNFNGIELKNDTLIMDNKINSSVTEITNYAPFITNMVSAKMIKLMYRAERVGDWTVKQTRQYELGIVRYFQHDHKPKHIRVLMVSFDYIDYEISRAGLSILPYLVLGFGITFICSAISTTISAIYMQQMSIYKIYLALFACICPLMANATAIGLLLTIGVRYDAILSVTPLLTLAIGVDDAYLMIHAWQRVTRECILHPVKDDCVPYRLALVLEETGPAILISALTNILADAVGSVSGSPSITVLCFGNMSSIFMDYVYQLTFYSAIMCVAGYFEMKITAEQQNTHSIKIDNEKKGTIINYGTKNSQDFRERAKNICTFILDGYVTLVTNRVFAVGVFCSWVLLIIISIFGITQIRIELTSEKLYPLDSPLIEFNDLLQWYQIPEHTMPQFYVNNPGNLSNMYRFQRLNQMVYELEHMNGSWGAQSTNYFIRDFIDFEKQWNEADYSNDSLNGSILLREDDLPIFLDWPEYQRWRGFLILDETTGHLLRFFFTTAYYGENLKDWPQRGALLNKWRDIIDKYREFNVTVFTDDAIFLDLIDNMTTDAWQSALGILLCMAFISFIFLYDIFTVAVVSVAIVSIMTGIVGILTLMGLNLEPIMMAAMLISMGFSVDIPAHVAYHYNSNGTTTNRQLAVKEKLRICFASVALPALQASISTSLCLFGLFFKELYIAQVFVKTMLLCIFLCVFHGLLIIPCMLVLTDLVMQFCRRLRRREIVCPAVFSS